MIDPATVPFIASMTHLKRFDECKEVLTSRSFVTGRFEDHSAPLIDGTFLFSNGRSHSLRRKELNKLTMPERLACYDEILAPIVSRSLEQLRKNADKNGLVRTDLMQFVRLILIQVAAAIVGLDDMEELEKGERLLDYVERFSQGVTVKWSTRNPDEVVAEALEVKKVFEAEYFAPALTRRCKLVERFAAGQLTLSDLPNDFLTISLMPNSAFEWNDDLRLKDSIILLNGGLGTSAGALAAAIDEYRRWERRDPSREDDSDYILQVLNETLRLHPPVPFLPRQATENVLLKSGRHVEPGEMVVVLPEYANTDPEAFGWDPEVFRPERAADLRPGVQPFGLAFGGGSHLCFGMPIVTQAMAPAPQDREFHRPMVLLLKELIKAGVERDFELEAPLAASSRPSYLDFPVVMPVEPGCPAYAKS